MNDAKQPQVEMCVHCGLRIYLDKSGPLGPVWKHHGSNFMECFGGLTTDAAPARPLAGEAAQPQDEVRKILSRFQCTNEPDPDSISTKTLAERAVWMVDSLAVSTPPVATPKQFDKIIQQIAELPDRSSPEDWPEAMLVTENELRMILWENLIAPAALSPAQAAPHKFTADHEWKVYPCSVCGLHEGDKIHAEPAAQAVPPCEHRRIQYVSNNTPTQSTIATRRCTDCGQAVQKEIDRDEQLKNLAALKDEDIDTSDIPELTQEQLKTAKRPAAQAVAGEPCCHSGATSLGKLHDSICAAPEPVAEPQVDNTFREDGIPFRRFYLRRIKDETGISRTGRVLEGVLTQSGKVLTEWRPPHSTMGIYNSLDEFKLIHVDCHPSCNEIVWLDEFAAEKGRVRE